MSATMPLWEYVAFATRMAGSYRAEGRNFVVEYLARARRYEADARFEREPIYRGYLVAQARFARCAVALVAGTRGGAIYQTGVKP